MTLGRPGVGEVHLWWAAVEDDRAARRAALRGLLGAYLGVPPAGVPLVEPGRGKPACPGSGLEFSTSHSGPWTAMAVTAGARVGVDVEFRADGVWEPFPVDLFLSPAEQDRLPESGLARRVAELWAMKEAVAKAIGTGLDPGPSELELVHDGQQVAVRLHGPWEPWASPGWDVRLVDSDAARICAIAVDGAWRRTSSRRWPQEA